ncbi:MAG: ATP-binding protein [Myxococcota bacterium]
MNVLLYLLSAIFAFILAARTWRSDRRDPTRRAFSGLSTLLGFSYLAFAIYLVTQTLQLRHLHIIIGAFVPAATMTLLHRLLGGETRSELGRRMWVVSGVLTAIIAPILGAGDLLEMQQELLPFELLVSTWAFLGLFWCVRWLWRRYQDSDDDIQRARIWYLLALMAAGVLFSVLEGVVRAWGRVGGEAAPFPEGFPPVGAVLSVWVLYLLHRVVELYRLIDIQETISRAVSLSMAAAALILLDVLFGGLSDSPTQGKFELFLIFVLFLFFFPDLRETLNGWVSQHINRQGQRLELTFREIERSLASVITMQDLESELLGRLHASGRVPLASLYLWDQGVFRLTLERGVSNLPMMRTIADRPFTDGFREGERLYALDALKRRVDRRLEGHEVAAARARTLEAMDAELTLPIASGELVLGWLNLRADPLAGGFSHEELRRLRAILDRTAVVLENLRGFEQLKEQHRLAALGTMAAGLAHEIRNPLAGIKGAAQYLEGDVNREEIADFVSLIVEETDRLSDVVSQFLTYARPFEVHTQPSDINELVTRTLDLIGAEGHPDEVELSPRLTEKLPEVPIDRDRIQQVLLNLIHNALHAIDGDGRVEVFTVNDYVRRAGHSRPAIAIQIVDNGPGIAPEDMEKLFIPFFTTRPRGTGLGLAISRRLVEAHGGEIEARSKPGQGAAFTVRLPLAEPVEPPHPAEDEEAPEETSQSTIRSRLRLRTAR